MNALPQDFWQKYRETVVKNLVTKFGYLHPAETNKFVMETLGMRSVADLWAWKKAHRAVLTRQINLALKPLGLRAGKSRGYLYTEKIAA